MTLLPRRYLDPLAAAALWLISFTVYVRTLAPGVAALFDDSLEFQLLASRGAIAHPTGYPFYSILLKIGTAWLPPGDTAYRANLLSAFFAACAVAALYVAAQALTRNRLAAFAAALAFAFSPTLWSQAVVAEVYTLQACLTALAFAAALSLHAGSTPTRSPRLLIAAAFFLGLGLSHHRMTVLLLPAFALYLLWTVPAIRRPRNWLLPLAAFLVPLSLYLYLPLRGAVGSLDGTYRNTLPGFISWVTASSYSVFLTDNPFNEQREAAYYLGQFLANLTPVGCAFAALGAATLWRRSLRAWALLVLALAANLAFLLYYRVADLEVFFIPAFLVCALFLAAGISAFMRWVAAVPSAVRSDVIPSEASGTPPEALVPSGANPEFEIPRSQRMLTRNDGGAWPRLRNAAAFIIGLVTLSIPLVLGATSYHDVRQDDNYAFMDYGRDLLSQPLPDRATAIGILGEMSLVRYLQEARGLLPGLPTIAADQPAARVAAIQAAVKNNRNVLLTRKLDGLEQGASLSSLGPWVRVLPTPNKTAPSPGHKLDLDFDGVHLGGYDLETQELAAVPGQWHSENGRRVRVTLYWRVDATIENDRFVSLKLVNGKGERGGQLDRRPVSDAYPTSAWRLDEWITDTYDLPVFAGAAPGVYSLQVTLYDPETGEVHGQADLAPVTVARDISPHRAAPEAVNVDHILSYRFGNLLLIGYSLDNSEPFAPSDVVPLTLLWRAQQAGATGDLELVLARDGNRIASSTRLRVGGPATAAGEYVRMQVQAPLPATLFGAPNLPREPATAFDLRITAVENAFCQWGLQFRCVDAGRILVKR